MVRMLIERFNDSVKCVMAICVDGTEEHTFQGRLYHCYSESPEYFTNVITLIKRMEGAMDSSGELQQSTELATFNKKKIKNKMITKGAERVMSASKVANQNGEKATFVVNVQYRQNSTWQGQVVWVEKNIRKSFRSTLEMLKLIDSALEMEEKETETKETKETE